MNLSSALEYSSQPPVSVYGTGRFCSLFLEKAKLDYRRSRSLAVLSQTYIWFNALFRQCAPMPLPRHFYRKSG